MMFARPVYWVHEREEIQIYVLHFKSIYGGRGCILQLDTEGTVESRETYKPGVRSILMFASLTTYHGERASCSSSGS